MTQLALVKRRNNFASDKQISHVTISTHTDKEKERLELSHAGISHTLHATLWLLTGTSPICLGYWNPSSEALHTQLEF